MTAIYIERPFLLKLDNGAQRSFAAGEQEVEEAMATHWYVQAHCIEKPVATPEPVRWPEPVPNAEQAPAQNPEQAHDAPSAGDEALAQETPQKSEPVPHPPKSGKKAKP
ncbi:Putative bacteriophage protein [Candidatus Glomeribacter gigasporarum BEG34]|uniref:Putative bacteriophage protein n=1 Tax=Candidatus Glomeribacter gigasporarum BEG34 TaxID=1070319 RepID=G2J771_9BURK|nr:hypothetical protein [Candidatus Glomeribacter gigasporarum]CCD28611.1 Putative bacteriophage protein [Candidatus Glomeribacter gigasporarum BEG34]